MMELPNQDVAHVDELLLDERGLMRVVPAAELRALDPMALRLWAHHRGVYAFPTAELVAWLADQLAGVKAIEIGAGHGALGRALGIPTTDSRQQERDPTTVLVFAAMGQPPVKYGPDVVTMDAAEAVRRYAPHTVVGAWITEKWRFGRDFGNKDGVEWDYVLARCSRVILIGNDAVHGPARVMARPHETLSFPWLVSRASRPDLDRIYVWKGERP